MAVGIHDAARNGLCHRAGSRLRRGGVDPGRAVRGCDRCRWLGGLAIPASRHCRADAIRPERHIVHLEIAVPAEQAIRPAVVNRKSCGGNRTWQGAQTQAILTSLFRTCHQRHLRCSPAASFRTGQQSRQPLDHPGLDRQCPPHAIRRRAEHLLPDRRQLVQHPPSRAGPASGSRKAPPPPATATVRMLGNYANRGISPAGYTPGPDLPPGRGPAPPQV